MHKRKKTLTPNYNYLSASFLAPTLDFVGTDIFIDNVFEFSTNISTPCNITKGEGYISKINESRDHILFFYHYWALSPLLYFCFYLLYFCLFLFTILFFYKSFLEITLVTAEKG